MKRFLLAVITAFLLGATFTPNHYPVNREGLIGWWSYRNSGSVSASGTCKDYSGNGNGGTLTGNAYIDNAGAHFDGSGDYINTSINTSDLNVNSPHTYCLWVKPTGTTSGDNSILYFGNMNAYTPNWHTDGIDGDSSGEGFVYAQYDGTRAEIGGTMTLNAWNFIVGVHDGTNLKAYLNGEYLGSVAKRSPTINSNSSLKISGNETNPSGSNFLGVIDDVMIFDRALSAGEIKQLYLKNKRN